MNVLIRMKSRIINEALYELLRSGDDTNRFTLDNQEMPAPTNGYDVIVTDSSSQNVDFEALWPDAKVLLVDTGLRQDEVISLLRSNKFYGVLSTNSDVSLMRKALGVVQRGQIWIDNENLKALLFKAGTPALNGGAIGAISKREQQIVDLLTKGMNNKEIGEALYVSVQTVKAHLSRIFRKFNVSSRTQLISVLMKKHAA